MKRRIDEVDDTADSQMKRPEGIASPDSLENFWTKEIDDLLLQEIAFARRGLGSYGGIKDWRKGTWDIMHMRLVIKNPDFQLLTSKRLDDRQALIQLTNEVNISSRVPPVGERDRLIYDAFKPEELPPSPPPIHFPKERRVRSRPRGVNVKNGNTRTTTNAPNINNTESCSSARHSGI